MCLAHRPTPMPATTVTTAEAWNDLKGEEASDCRRCFRARGTSVEAAVFTAALRGIQAERDREVTGCSSCVEKQWMVPEDEEAAVAGSALFGESTRARERVRRSSRRKKAARRYLSIPASQSCPKEGKKGLPVCIPGRRQLLIPANQASAREGKKRLTILSPSGVAGLFQPTES